MIKKVIKTVGVIGGLLALCQFSYDFGKAKILSCFVPNEKEENGELIECILNNAPELYEELTPIEAGRCKFVIDFAKFIAENE